MTAYLVQKVVILNSPSAVKAILKLSEENRILVIQQDSITLLDHDVISAELALTTEVPYCVVSNTLATLSKKRLTFVTAEGHRLRKRTSCFPREVDVICGGTNCFYRAWEQSLYRHNVDDRFSILKKFDGPIRALSAAAERLLVMLSTTLHVIDLETHQDLLEVSCDVANPIDLFWSLSARNSFWFLAVIRPQPMDGNRTHKILMAEVNDHLMKSEDVSPVDVSLERRLKCAATNDKMLTLAENGNVILIYQIDNFGKLNLLYRAEATDSSFTAGEILRASKGPTAPRIALGTMNGAVAFLDES